MLVKPPLPLPLPLPPTYIWQKKVKDENVFWHFILIKGKRNALTKYFTLSTWVTCCYYFRPTISCGKTVVEKQQLLSAGNYFLLQRI